MTVPVSALQEIAPSAIIELFLLELNAAQHGINETYRFHAGVNADDNNNIVWAGNEYIRFPIEADGFKYDGQGQLPRPTLRVSNVFGTITALLLTLPNGLEGAKVTRIRTLARYLDAVNFPGNVNPLGTPDPTAEFPHEVFYVDRKATENRDVIEFELAAVFDLIGVRAPKRQCVSNVCQWKYRGPECGYTGNAYFNLNDEPVATLAEDACGKRLRSCELRFEQQRRTGSVTVGSNILTLTQPASFSTGEPVSGFGIPAGATVSSVSGNLVTLSANATATTAVARTGTIQSNYSQIIVTSAVGIVPGMAVSGAYLPANSQVVTVSGNTVTLSSPVDLTQFFTVVGSANSVGTVGQSIYFLDGTPLSVGWFAASSVMPLQRRAQIATVRSFTRKEDNPFGTGHVVIRRTVAELNQSPLSGANAAWTFYVENPIPAATYTFTATNTVYTFRSDNAIPYGSFPGIGAYTA